MAPESFTDLIGLIRHSFFVVPSAEVAIEIDPRTLSAPIIEALALGGVNRASLGVQSFDPQVQQAINRVQSFEQTERAVTGLRRAGIAGINPERGTIGSVAWARYLVDYGISWEIDAREIPGSAADPTTPAPT